MKLQTLIIVLGLWLFCSGCESSNLNSLNNEQINSILAHVNEDEPEFVEKGITFDSIVTVAGYRTLDGQQERIKARLYFFGDRLRGYYNLTDRNDKNLQVFGRKVREVWAIKCVTKLDMEEAGGYLIFEPYGSGIWSNGHYNFVIGSLLLSKQNKDYDILESW